MASSKNVVFDIVGTLVGYEALFEAIEARLGERLKAHGVGPAALFGYTWVRWRRLSTIHCTIQTTNLDLQIEVAEREYTYLSISGLYRPYATVFESIFWRMLYKAGVPEPRKFADEKDLEAIMIGYKAMELRPGATECVQKLRDADFTVYGFTMGDSARVGGYFKAGGLDWAAENLLSCDTRGVGKPDPEAYKPLLNQLSISGKPWFAAAVSAR